MTIEQAISSFMLSRKAQGATRKTILYYTICLEMFEKFLISKKIFELENIRSEHIREYLVEAQERVCLTSVRTYFRAIRAFLNFLTNEEYLKVNPATTVKMPKAEQKIPRTFNAKEVKTILNAFDKTEFIGLRNYSIMATLFSTGLRRQELLELCIQDINFTVDSIRVKNGKGHKERLVPLGRSLRKILLIYLRERENFLEGRISDWLWINIRGDNLRASGINSVFGKLKEEINLGKDRVSSHTWRHSFAKNYLLNGGEIFSLQKILGHSDLATTRLYLNLNEKEIKLQHAKYDPLANQDWML